MGSSPHRRNESPDEQSSKKPRRDDTVVHDDLTLSLFPPRHNIKETASTETTPESIAPLFPQPSPPLSYTTMFLPNIPMPLQQPASYSIYQQHLDPRPSTPVIPTQKPPRPPRKNTTQKPKKEGKTTTVPAIFDWAKTSRATVHSLEYLLSNEIETIKGEVKCKRCEEEYQVSYNLREKFCEVWTFVAENLMSLNDRAPDVWMTPTFPTCKFCHQENSARPVIPLKKREINWLFLLLGQMLGCCTLEQLKYFCKHTKNHRTGAKDRLLYLTYLGLCKQLDPSGPFNHPWT